MDFLFWLLAQGAVVSLVVDALKKFTFVQKHPKLVASALNTLALLLIDYATGRVPANVVNFVLSIATAFAASVGFYQVKKDATS